MQKWIPLTLAMSAFLLSACGQKTEKADQYEAEPLPEPEMVLPEPPPMDTIEEAPPEPEPVVVPEPEPEPKPEPKPKYEPNYGIVKDGPYVLQVAISNQERSIRNLAERLRKDGFPAYVVSVQNPTSEMQGTYFRVRIGSFANTRTAREYGKRNLEPQGLSYWADLKARDSEPVHQVIEAPKVEPKPEPMPEPKPDTAAAEQEATTDEQEPELPPAEDTTETKPVPAPSPSTEANPGSTPSLPDW